MKWVNPFVGPRDRMVSDQVLRRGVTDRRVLDAMHAVPREAFVPESLRDAAYSDKPLPIGEGQTISQPYVVGAMAEALRLGGGENVLEIGTGSGYAAAVLAHLARAIHSVERLPNLARRARDTLRRLGYDSVEVIEGDGSRGWVPAAPYDAIVVAAGAPRLPRSLCAQLRPGGRLVMPVADQDHGQVLVRLVRGDGNEDLVERLEPVRFVPLIGAEGWTDEEEFRNRTSQAPTARSGEQEHG